MSSAQCGEAGASDWQLTDKAHTRLGPGRKEEGVLTVSRRSGGS